MKKILPFAAIVIMLSGCCWFLPEGEPPAGNILDNPQNNSRKVYTVREAIDYMTSALTLAMLTQCPGENVSITNSNNDTANAIAAITFNESSKITGNKHAQEAEWELRSNIQNNEMTLTLLRQGQPVWQETICYQ